jgi:hypothetical protein
MIDEVMMNTLFGTCSVVERRCLSVRSKLNYSSDISNLSTLCESSINEIHEMNTFRQKVRE